MELLERINEIERTTGLRIIDNIWDFGSCSVIDESRKVHYRGDRITCRLFINTFYDSLLNSENKIS